jgi:hypothetical protein
MKRPFESILAPLLGLLVFLGVSASTPPVGRAAATSKPCWARVIDDWLDNGTIDGAYKPACYQDALKHLPEDLRDYTDVSTAVSVALQDALRRGGSSGGAVGGVLGTSNGGVMRRELGAGGAATTDPGLRGRTVQSAPSRSIYRTAVDKLGTTGAESLPIPVLVLAGLGTALLVAALVFAARKRMRAR